MSVGAVLATRCSCTPDVAHLGVAAADARCSGFANAGIWAPLRSTATRNLPPRQAGAGSGVYNTTRQIGAVLGSAAIAALIQARLVAELPAGPGAGGGWSPMGFGGALPEPLA